jgi:hypothetical protein
MKPLSLSKRVNEIYDWFVDDIVESGCDLTNWDSTKSRFEQASQKLDRIKKLRDNLRSLHLFSESLGENGLSEDYKKDLERNLYSINVNIRMLELIEKES